MVGIPPSAELFTKYCRSQPNLHYLLPHPLYPALPEIAPELLLPGGKTYQSDQRARRMSELLKKDPRNAYALAASEGLKPEQLIIEQYAAGMTIRYIAAIFHKRRLFISAIVQPVFGKVASGNHCRNISNDCVRATYIGAGQRSTRKTAKLLGVSADTISRRLQQTIDGYLGS